MGLNLTIHVVEKEANEEYFSFVKRFLNLLKIQVHYIEENRTYRDVFEKLYHDFSGRKIGVSEYENRVIFFDQNSKLYRTAGFKKYTAKNDKLIFSMSRGDTANVDFYSFHGQGQCLRDYTNNEGDIHEEGEPLLYERDGNGLDEILENFVISYYKFDSLIWNIYTIENMS